MAWKSAITRGSPKRRAERALAGLDRGLLEAVQRVLGQHTLVADAFDFEELAIDLVPQVPEMRQVVDAPWRRRNPSDC